MYDCCFENSMLLTKSLFLIHLAHSQHLAISLGALPWPPFASWRLGINHSSILRPLAAHYTNPPPPLTAPPTGTAATATHVRLKWTARLEFVEYWNFLIYFRERPTRQARLKSIRKFQRFCHCCCVLRVQWYCVCVCVCGGGMILSLLRLVTICYEGISNSPVTFGPTIVRLKLRKIFFCVHVIKLFAWKKLKRS